VHSGGPPSSHRGCGSSIEIGPEYAAKCLPKERGAIAASSRVTVKPETIDMDDKRLLRQLPEKSGYR
jgi:hypothetical protein